MKAYVWNETEVKMTGRTAKRSSDKKVGSRRGGAQVRIDILYEIEPVAANIDGNWKKWVRKDDLYEIIYEPESDDVGIIKEEVVSSGKEGSNNNRTDGK